MSLKNEKTETVLMHLQEELAECIQAASKMARFGPEDYWPDRGMSNRQYLSREIGNVMALVKELENRYIVLPYEVDRGVIDKIDRIRKWGGDLYDFSKWDESYRESEESRNKTRDDQKGPCEI